MTVAEVNNIVLKYLPYEGEDKMKIFHNRESGEVIVIIYNPNILGITKLRDLLTLNAEGLRNLLFYYRTRDVIELDRILEIFRTRIDRPASMVELMIEPQQIYNEATMKLQSLIDQSKPN